jgi:hypothetical protein
MSLPEEALAGIDGLGGNRAWPATPLGARAAGALAPLGYPLPPTVALMQKPEDGEIVFRHACKFGFEGIVSKRKDSAYRSGRAPDLAQDEEPGLLSICNRGRNGCPKNASFYFARV